MLIYSWIKPKEHMITVRNRVTGYAKQHRVWNTSVIENVLAQQEPDTDVFITKYPKNRLVETIILDFDSEDIDEAYKDVNRMRNYLSVNGHNCVIVKSGSKGYHLYIQIAPFLFKDTDIRRISNWSSYFNAFVCFLIHDGERTVYPTLDKVNFSAGLNGNIRLIGSVHPKTSCKCEIIEGEFISNQLITNIQDSAQRKACQKLIIQEEDRKRILKQTKVSGGSDPIAVNDLRKIIPEITGNPVKIYPKGYAYTNCFEHSDSHPSLLVTKEWYSCSGCGAKGNIWTLKKKGLIEFDDDGGAKW